MNLLPVLTLLVFLNQPAVPIHDLIIPTFQMSAMCGTVSQFRKTPTGTDQAHLSWRVTPAAVGEGIAAARSHGR
jgi:hypothetical protein